MILERFYDEKLAQASWLVGCQETGEALVIDPNRDVEQYIRAAEEEGVQVTHVTETHIHADFVSGSRELAHLAGALLLLSDEGGEGWRYGFADSDGATPLRDGDVFRVGNVRVDVLHTPGHTPEHVAFMITDTRATDRPMGVFTGDFIFVGDVGRPDLLEKAAGVVGTMEAGARQLFRSLERMRQLPDHLQIWPGHGAGSACGKALGAIPSSTLGYERIANPGLRITDEAEFVSWVLEGQPEPPRYFREMKRINRDGPPILGGFRRPERLQERRLPGLLEDGAIVVDTRAAGEFAVGHVPGTINIPLNRSFTTWAGWLLPYDADFHLIVEESCRDCVDEAVRDLAMIGLDRVAGHFGSGVIQEWSASGRPLETITHASVQELATKLDGGDVALLDVRGLGEWEEGRIPGAPNIPLGHLTEGLDRLPRDRPLVLSCQSGSRSAIAASLLRARGFENVVNLSGGFDEWRASGHPVEAGAVGRAKSVPESTPRR